MILISILIALLVEKYANWHTQLRNTSWFTRYVDWVHDKLDEHEWVDGPAGLIVIIAPILVIVGYISSTLDGYHSFFSLIFGIGILSYSIGPKKFHENVQKFIHSREQGDDEGALWHLDNILGTDTPKSEPLIILKLNEEILIQTSRQLLSIVFWFIILGPIGAILLRLSNTAYNDKISNEEDSEFNQSAARLQYILHWIPCRLTALSYAISGSFVHASDCWKNTPKRDTEETFIDKNNDMLTCIGLSSLQLGATDKNGDHQNLNLSSVNDTLKLGLRSITVWVTLIAIMTLAGWLG